MFSSCYHNLLDEFLRMNARHLDLENFEGFGERDLHKLIKRTVADLKESDKHRRENFKRLFPKFD